MKTTKNSLLNNGLASENKWIIPSILFLISILTTFIFYDPIEQPIFKDRAYFIYNSNLLAKGFCIYKDSIVGYTPLGYIFSAIFIKIFSLFSPDTYYYAPRIGGLIVNGMISIMIYRVLLELSTKKYLAISGSLLFISIVLFHMLGARNLEPKSIIALFTLFSIHFTLKENWLWAAFFAALSFSIWQPSFVISLSLFVYIIVIKKLDLKNFRQFVIGNILGILPTLLYLLYKNSWLAFYQLAILRKSDMSTPEALTNPIKWIFASFRIEPFLISAAFIGVAFFIFQLFRKQANPKYGFLFALFLFISAWNCVDFGGGADLLPMIPVLIIWSVFLIEQIKIPAWLVVTLSFVFVIFKNYDKKIGNNISKQKKVIERIDRITKGEDIICVNYINYYVYNNLKSPFRQIHFYDAVMNHTEKDGCKGLLAKIKNRSEPIWILYPVKGKKDQCTRKIIKQFPRKGSKEIEIRQHLFKLSRLH